MHRRIGFAVVAALCVSAGAYQASAAAGEPPLILRLPVDDGFVTNGLCGYPLEIRTTGTAVVHVFPTDLWDERVIITAPQTRLTFTNLLTGESIWTPSVNMVMQIPHEDGTGTKTLRGLLWRLVLPGEGLVTADAGRIDFLFTFDDAGNIVSEELVFSAGQQNGDFFEQTCAALAG
jgi:hypothetical protein